MTFQKLEVQNGHDAGKTRDVTRSHDPDTSCGLGSFHPAILQGFARIGAFVGVYSVSGLLTSTLAVYINSQVSMLEKQFGFSSAETGLLMSCNDIGYMCCVIFAGYIARKVHIPRGLGLSTMFFGICGLLCALPYFIQDPSTYEIQSKPGASRPLDNITTVVSMGKKKVPMCINDSLHGEDGCNAAENSAQATANMQELYLKKVAYYLIAIGMVFQGVGKSCRFPFVTIYIDDAVDKRKTGFYMGILIGTGIFGPALAYLLGGLFSKIYVTLKPVDITPSDPRWIGAWWLGFLVFGACSLFFSLPIMCFPRTLKSKSRRKELEGTDHSSKKVDKSGSKTLINELMEFTRTTGRVLRNPVYISLTLSTCMNLIGVAGVLSFMPKYLAAQYSIPLWQANIILSLSSIAAVSMGSFLGGVMTRRIDMTPTTTTKLIFFFFVVNILCLSSGFYLGCDQPSLVGDNGKGNISPLYTRVEQSCIEGCTCEDEKYFPVCGDDGRSYFSPCHAGCTSSNGKEFMNCTCVSSGHAVAGLCDQGCSTNLYVYAVLTFVGKLFDAFKIIPSFLAQIRCVDENDRAAATAFLGFITSAIGWMPGPVIFGSIIDGTCTLWKYTCGERQSCLLYDIVFFRTTVHGYAAVTSSLAMLTVGSLYIYFRVKGVTKWHSEEMKRQTDDIEEAETTEKEINSGDKKELY